jgi:hypothetical protein
MITNEQSVIVNVGLAYHRLLLYTSNMPPRLLGGKSFRRASLEARSWLLENATLPTRREFAMVLKWLSERYCVEAAGRCPK